MNVLVLCHGNRYRSPFAEGMLQRLRPEFGFAVKSAGVKDPIGNHPAAKPAREAAAKRGFDLSRHRAQALTQELLDWADITLYMDKGNLRRLIERFPVEAMDAICLASYVGAKRIPDPCFLPNDQKEQVWKLLEKSCRAFIKTI